MHGRGIESRRRTAAVNCESSMKWPPSRRTGKTNMGDSAPRSMIDACSDGSTATPATLSLESWKASHSAEMRAGSSASSISGLATSPRARGVPGMVREAAARHSDGAAAGSRGSQHGEAARRGIARVTQRSASCRMRGEY